MAGHTLLLADHSITIRRVVELTFADQGVRVVTAADGEEAIELLRSTRPSLVLVDVAVPKVDGYDVAKFVRSRPELRGVPVVLLAGAFDPVDEARLRDCGAADVLVKPFEPNVVIRRVKELLGLGDSEPPVSPSAGRLITAAPPRVVAARTPPPERPLSDSDAAWDALRASSGLAPDAPPVESATPSENDYLDSLNRAFDTLDAKLAGRAVPRSRPSAGAQRPAAPSSRPERASGGAHSEVFEVDEDWFIGAPAAAGGPADQSLVEDVVIPPADEPRTPARPATVVPPPPAPLQTPAGRAPAPPPAQALMPPAPRPVPPPAPVPAAPPAQLAPPAPPAVDVADAFAEMLAAEQGEPRAASPARPAPPPPAPPAFEITDALIERIAAEVARRLVGGPLRDAVADVVGASAERLVREEIERIRAKTREG